MRELVFTLTYDPGHNRVADTVAAYPGARIRSLSLYATEESLWRVDHASGTPDALAAIEEAFLTGDYYADCLATEDCGASQTTQVLEHTEETLVLYSYWERTDICESVPHIALDHLGDGTLFETRHENREYTWRIIHSDGSTVREFFDALERALGEGVELHIQRLTDASAPMPDDAGGLRSEQEAALRAAVEHGYYETPRKVDVSELSERLDVPRSTLNYRLRQAEAHLATQYVDRTHPPQETPPSL